MAMTLILLLLSNNGTVMIYSVFGILYHTHSIETNYRRRTTISISDIYNIIHNVKEMNSF